MSENWIEKIRHRGDRGLPSLEELSGWGGPQPCWDGDNSRFVVEYVLPRLGVKEEVSQVIRWAYGYDGSERSYEADSDGSTIVPDVWLGGSLKEPFGVAHDMFFVLKHEGKADPSGHIWSLGEANFWYFKAMTDFGMPVRAVIRLVGLTLGSWSLWWGIIQKILGESTVKKIMKVKQSKFKGLKIKPRGK